MSRPRSTGPRLIGLAAAFAFLGFAGSAFAAGTPDEKLAGEKLKAVQAEIQHRAHDRSAFAEMAEKLGGEIASLQDQTVTAAKATQADETAMTGLEAELQHLAAERQAATDSLQRRKIQYQQLLMALGRLASNPPEALVLMPGEPIDVLRGGSLLGRALPRIEAEAHALRGDVASLAELQSRIDAKTQEIGIHRAGLARQQAALSTLILRKSELRKGAEASAEVSAQRLQQLSSEARDLRDLVGRIEKETQQAIRIAALARVKPPRPPTPPPSPPLEAAPAPAPVPGAPTRLIPAIPEPAKTAPAETDQEGSSPQERSSEVAEARISQPKPKGIRNFTAAKGAMILPAAGPFLRRFGDIEEAGTASKGLRIETRPGAQVVAPFDGRVEFAGPFRGYDQILIIEHGDGYHSLLAGLQRIDAAVGQWLVTGEPVGVTSSDGKHTSLYMELWRHGQPIDPTPWLGSKESGTNG